MYQIHYQYIKSLYPGLWGKKVLFFLSQNFNNFERLIEYNGHLPIMIFKWIL
jgi:hypothetical protein